MEIKRTKRVKEEGPLLLYPILFPFAGAMLNFESLRLIGAILLVVLTVGFVVIYRSLETKERVLFKIEAVDNELHIHIHGKRPLSFKMADLIKIEVTNHLLFDKRINIDVRNDSGTIIYIPFTSLTKGYRNKVDMFFNDLREGQKLPICFA